MSEHYEQPEIVVIGAASLDIKGRMRDEMIEGTSNAGIVTISIGGVARNIAENLARLGAATALIAVVGSDAFGQAIVNRTRASGVDTSRVITINDHSAAYLALFRPDGHLLMALDDSHCARLIAPEHIQTYAGILRNARMVVIDANVARVTTAEIIRICTGAGVPICFEPVAYGLAERYKEMIGNFYLVTPNELEAQALTGIEVRGIDDATRAAQRLVATGVHLAIVTLARHGLVYATPEEHGHVPAIPCQIVDPTGAGDALVAAVIYSILQGLPIDEAVRLGVSAATLTLLSPETVRGDLSLESLYARLVI
ncbi:MAG: carbohydrate kinase [Herpetosiphonaceae bacterium]|nr:MAG: carbohydrate kinase [Herpetosiphonaceae bacterium]